MLIILHLKMNFTKCKYHLNDVAHFWKYAYMIIVSD